MTWRNRIGDSFYAVTIELRGVNHWKEEEKCKLMRTLALLMGLNEVFIYC